MISYDALLNEIEQLLATAKTVNDEQQRREQISAIRALCNVALANDTKSQLSSFTPTSVATAHSSQPIIQTTMNQPSSLNGSKLQESDANGESIFDF